MTPENTVVTSTKPAIFKDFWRYTAWWLLWVGGLGFLQGIGGGADPVLALASSVVTALICAILFTVMQNLVNAKRRKPIAWALAIGIWMGVKIAFVLMSR